jgi:hypothetical protein
MIAAGHPDAVGVVSIAGLVGMQSERHGAQPAHAKSNADTDSDHDYRYADAIDRSRWKVKLQSATLEARPVIILASVYRRLTMNLELSNNDLH